MASDLVYVGTYTRSGKSKGIHVFRHDTDSGKLALLRIVPAPDPSFLALSPDRSVLFAVGETKQYEGQLGGSVASFRIEPDAGDLSFINRQATHGGDPCHLCTDPTGRFLFVANHEHGNVAVLPIRPDGALAPASDLRQDEGAGPGPTQKGPHAHFVALDPAGRIVLVNDKGIDKVMLYRLDAAAGKLVPHNPPFARLHAGAAPRHLAFHPSGRFAYVNGEADMTVTAFAYDGARGMLEELHYVSTLPAGTSTSGVSTAHILVEPAGRFLYVSNRGHDSIAIFAIDEHTGRLTTLGHQATGGRTPRNFAIDPTGRFLYAANQNSDTIVHFRLDKRTGTLEATGDVTSVGAPVCVLFA